MQCELLHILPPFLETYRGMPTKTKEIDFGPVAVQLINIVEQIHLTKNILLDVKPDNLMVNYNFILPTTTKSKNSINTTEALAQSIRLVDFGLLKHIVGTDGKHMENVDTKDVQGTPLYASLHVHESHMPSRRDDMYAMLFVIGDVILHANGVLNNTNAPYGTGTKLASYFPWSQEGNDKAIGDLKAEQMKTIKSSYFTSMPTKKIAESLFAAHNQMHNTTFKQVPDYNSIRTLLNKIKIPVSTSTISATYATNKRSNNQQSKDVVVETSSSLRRSARHTNHDQVFEPPPSKMKKANSPLAFVEEILSDSDVTMHDAEQGYDEDSDVEMIDIDHGNCKPAAVVAAPKTLQVSRLQFTIEGGENNTMNKTVILDESSIIVIGSSSTKSTIELPNLSQTHVRLTLSKSIPNAIKVEPLGKQSVVQVNRTNIPLSGTVAFIGQVISFGPYSIRKIQRYQNQVSNETLPAAKSTSAKRSDHQRKTCANMNVEQKSPIASKVQQPIHQKPTAPHLVLKVTKPASLNGTSYVLERGVSDTIIFGSGSNSNEARNNQHQWISLDQSTSQMDAKHASVTLMVHKDGTKMVEVQDFKGSSGTYVSNKCIPTGKKQMVFGNQTIRMGNVEFVVVDSV
jgi:serine/threonine protein kinase